MDQDGDVIDILLQPRRDQRAAERFLRRLVRGQSQKPFRIVTDKLKSYSAAKRTILPDVTHDTQQYANNRAELSHQPTRRENGKCADSNLPGRLNDFYQHMVSSRIYFEWDANI